ncbi:MAG TPA: bacillithiol transferase BstA [Pseudoneobacillus sp.]|nr:bacillithiol transferase BstA [Pseudoneobacillus sp.]
MDLRYPVGTFKYDGEPTNNVINAWINEIERAPQALREAVKDLAEEQLDTPYREGGWTVRQVVHHIVDSHINSYCRFKLALTEEQPIIKPYKEDKWAELSDSELPIEVSLILLENLHKRWVHLLRSLSTSDLKRTYMHPESGVIPLGLNIGLYAWHGRHHIAHITSLRERKNW